MLSLGMMEMIYLFKNEFFMFRAILIKTLFTGLRSLMKNTCGSF